MPETGTDFNGCDVAIVMPTSYKQLTGDGEDPVRYSCTRTMVTALSGRPGGIKTQPLIIDSSPPEMHQQLSDELTQLGAVVLRAPRQGILWQNLDGLNFAYTQGAPFAGRAEPFKYGLAVPAVIERVMERLIAGIDVLCVGRDADALASLPPVQRDYEGLIADAGVKYGLPAEWDMASGIRFFSQAGLRYLANFAQRWGQDNSQWEFMWGVPLLGMHQRTSLPPIRVDGIAVPQIHPQSITVLETGNPVFDTKRQQQYELVTGFMDRFCLNLGISPASA